MSKPRDNKSENDRLALVQQVVEEYIDRRAHGEAVTDDELEAAHPELMPEMGEALRDVRFVQQAQAAADQSRSGGLHIRCPHCHHPIEIVDDSSLSDVVCPSCGSGFSLTDDSERTFQASQQEMVNHFQLLDRVGVGAFGSVWSARDTQLDRVVALKIPRKGELSPEEAEQFIREARAAAQLKHPHIVSVLEVGRYKDRIYIACDFIQGLDLADWLTDHQATPREAAELCVTVADALEHAHRHGVIHRDLKPSNIMLDAEGEPHLMDFGLAKRDAGEMTMTVDGKLLGTPAYMSPEQARGAAHEADARSDVYSLGVILFELLTGERPFRGNTRMLLHQVLVEDAPSPRKLNSAVPRDLETICLKCLEKHPDRRYSSAVNLRDDLQRFLRGEPVTARPMTRVARAWKWSRRHPAPAAVLALITLLSILGPAVAIRIASLANNLRATSQRERTSKEEYRRLLYVADMEVAKKAFEEANTTRTISLLERHVPLPGQIDYRSFEWCYLWSACKRSIMMPTFTDKMMVGDIHYSPDGRSITTLSHGGALRRRDTETLEIIDEKHLSSQDAAFFGDTFVISPDGEAVAIAIVGGSVRLTDLVTDTESTIETPIKTIRTIAFSPNGEYLASGGSEGTIVLLNRRTQEIEREIQAHVSVASLTFSSDSRWLASGGDEAKVKLWAIPSGEPVGDPIDVSPFCRQGSQVKSLAFAPDDRQLAIGTSGDPSVYLCDVTHTRALQLLGKSRDDILDLAFSPDGKILATNGPVVKLWNVQNHSQIDQLMNRQSGLETWIEFSPDGNTLATSTGSFQGVRLWNLKEESNPSILDVSSQPKSMAMSPDGSTFAISSDDGVVAIWDTVSRRVIRRFDGKAGLRLAYSPTGKLLAGVGGRSATVWEISTGRLVRSYEYDGHLNTVAVSPNDRTLAAAARNGTVAIWDLVTDDKFSIKSHDLASFVTFSPVTGTLACAGYDIKDQTYRHSVRCWDVGRRAEVCDRISGRDSDFIWHIAFSPDESKFAMVSQGGIVRLWDAGNHEEAVLLWDILNQEETAVLEGHAGEALSISFSADGSQLVTSDRKHMKIWNTRTGELHFAMNVHDGTMSQGLILGPLLMTPDLKTMISYDGKLKIWRTASDEDVAVMRRRWLSGESKTFK